MRRARNRIAIAASSAVISLAFPSVKLIQSGVKMVRTTEVLLVSSKLCARLWGVICPGEVNCRLAFSTLLAKHNANDRPEWRGAETAGIQTGCAIPHPLQAVR